MASSTDLLHSSAAHHRTGSRTLMPTITTSDGVDIHYQQFGARANPTVLLIHGLTCQIVHWPQPLIDRLTKAGYRVVVFDNRDAGLSSKLEHLETGTVEQIMSGGRAMTAPYNLGDMARDAVAVLDYLGQSGAHLVGLSMGGMIAQRMAIDYPQRVFSLTSIMSSTSDPDLPGADRATFDAFVSTPPADRTGAIAHLTAGWRALGGPHFDSAAVGLARQSATAYDRGYSPSGTARQLLAILTAAPRGDALKALDLPALVLHGTADPLVPLAAGERTAECLKNAHLQVFEDMGHDLPDPLLSDIAEAIVRHLDRAPVQR